MLQLFACFSPFFGFDYKSISFSGVAWYNSNPYRMTVYEYSQRDYILNTPTEIIYLYQYGNKLVIVHYKSAHAMYTSM